MSLRPTTLKDIADRSDSLDEFGRHLRDWLHELRRMSSRKQAASAVQEEPPKLAHKFSEGTVADAWLAAYAEHLSSLAGIAPPDWAFRSWRTSAVPLFGHGFDTPALRMLALSQTPLAFKRRNIYTPSVDLPLRLRAGRPTKSMQDKRRSNAERQRRFRKARRAELEALRRLARKYGAARSPRQWV